MDDLISLLNETNSQYILLGFGILLLLIQLYFIVIIHGKLAFFKVKTVDEDGHLPPLSVIIWTRNEEELLKQNLDKILLQDYPEFEVVVVNDRSEDDSKWLLQEMAAKYSHLNVTEIADHVLSRRGKKFGVAIGIKAAKYEHLVFTDTQCTPASDQWLRHLGHSFGEETEFVLGYAPLIKKKGFNNPFIRLEHYFRSINYLSFALAGKAYMGLSQNMAFVKDLFFKGKGFASHIHVTSGYAELFVNQHATKRNTVISINKEAHVWQPSPVNDQELSIQKDQNLAVAQLYKSAHKTLLNIQALTGMLWYVFLVAFALIFTAWWQIALGLYLFRLLIQILVYIPISKKLRITKMMWFLPLIDFGLSMKLAWRTLFAKTKKYGTH